MLKRNTPSPCSTDKKKANKRKAKKRNENTRDQSSDREKDIQSRFSFIAKSVNFFFCAPLPWEEPRFCFLFLFS